MSVIHIGTSGGNVVCGRTQVRSILTPDEFKKLSNEGRIRTQVKGSVKHSGCKVRPCDCPRKKFTRTAMCKDCTS